MIKDEELDRYIGREETGIDIADPERMLRLAALLDRRWIRGAGMPPLGHFLLFRPDEIQSRIGSDGHPLREPDGMLPAIALPRRMWAGSRIRFERAIEPGSTLVRRSRLKSAVPKSGKSGSMVFCTVEHEISSENGELLIAEEQDIVYREAHSGPDLASRPAVPAKFEPEFETRRKIGPVELFRYSALTFNSHRIHYDRDYARTDEGYHGLVVHGPYLATMLFDHLVQVIPGCRVAEFTFKAVSPSFDGEELVFGAAIEGGKAQLSVTNPSGLAMTGEAILDGE